MIARQSSRMNPGQECFTSGVIYTHNVIKQEAICIQVCTLQYFVLIIKIKKKKPWQVQEVFECSDS